MKTFVFILLFSVNGDSAYFPEITSFSKILKEPVDAIFALSLGIREAYSDILYIRLLQYYGTNEEGEGVFFDYGSGKYPLFYQKAFEIALINPYFKNAIMTASGALAFNLKRTYQGISILRFALSYDKENYNYILLLSAILTYQSRKNIYDFKLLSELYEISIRNDSPIMLVNITAFLLKNAKKYDMALKLYKIIIERSNDKFYIENAKKQINLIKTLKK